MRATRTGMRPIGEGGADVKITVGETTYTRIRNLSFAPETDVAGTSFPVNEFSLEVLTDDNIKIGDTVKLLDDLDQLWAEYECVYVERVYNGWLKIRCRSKTACLDTITCDPEVYAGDTVGDIAREVAYRALIDLDVDPELEDIELNGYVPKQSARDRLAQIAFVAGGYFKDFNQQGVSLLKIADVTKLVPLQETYWRPVVTHTDPIAFLHLESWTLYEQDPQPGQQSVEVDGHTYVLLSVPVEIDNHEVPFAYQTNGVVIDNVTIINDDNVDDVATNMAKYYFPAVEAEAEVINNRQYEPGDKVTIVTGTDSAVTGYVEKCTFTFGTQAKSKLELTACASVETGKLIVRYMWDDVRIGKEAYNFPVGYHYRVFTKSLDKTMNNHRYVFYPEHGDVVGDMTAGTKTEIVQNDVALDLHKKVLTILIVDEFELLEQEDADGNTIRIGVIG